MVRDQKIADKVAGALLEIGAIRLDLEVPFTWASGWRSPIYCDNRLALSYPETREFIKKALVNTLQEVFGHCQVVAGVATAGIPQGALVADELGLPFIYVRSKPKGHGLANQIEGKIIPGGQVVVIEDLVSTGGSSLNAVEAIRAADMGVLGMISIFTYGFDLAYENFDKARVNYVSLSDYNALIGVAAENGLITEDQVKRLEEWRASPETWS